MRKGISSSFKGSALHKKAILPVVKRIMSENHYRINWQDGGQFQKIKTNFLSLTKYCDENVKGENIDRHKVASCLCGAILLSKVLVHKDGLPHNANEILAVGAGLSVLKMYKHS